MDHPDDIDDLLAVAIACADVARPEALSHFRRSDLSADNKAADGFDPVTAADVAVEAAIRQCLARRRPEDGVLGEEDAPTPGRSGLTWVIDPIDGTRAYLCGAPTWGVLVAVNAGGPPLLGVVDQPFTGERFIGVPSRAEALWQRGDARRRLSCRPCPSLADATLMATAPDLGTATENEAFQAIARQTRLVRYGMDCYAYALLAMGCIDIVIESGLKPFDIQAPMALIEAAGGIVTDWQGGPAHQGGRVVAAGDGRAHAQALERLSRVA
jgi:histidinol phosphatase-like enzyme (inositol monophosphatase family)